MAQDTVTVTMLLMERREKGGEEELQWFHLELYFTVFYRRNQSVSRRSIASPVKDQMAGILGFVAIRSIMG